MCVSYGPKPRFMSGSVVIQGGPKEGLDVIVILPKKAIQRLLKDPLIFG